MLLINAVRFGRIRQVQLLLKTGINVDLRDEKGRTALIHCCFIKDPQTRTTILKLLLAQRPKVNRRDHLGRSVLLWACLLGRVDVLTGLINDPRSDVETNLVDNDGNSALLLAVKSGHLSATNIILNVLQRNVGSSNVAVIHGSNNAGICPLIAAFNRGEWKCAQLLVKEGAQISSVVKYIKQRMAQEDDEGSWASQEGLINFLGKSHDPRFNADVLTDKGLLEFLFAKTDTSQRRHSDGCTARAQGAGIISENDEISTRATVGPYSRRSIASVSSSMDFDTDSSGDCSHTDVSMAGGACANNGQLDYELDFASTQDSVLKLYDIYAAQLTPSYRKGMPICRYKTPPPPPPPRKESKSTRPNRVSLQHSSGSDVSKYLSTKRGSATSSTGLPSMQESAFDRQMRLKYARSSRAASVQVAKLPPIGFNGKKLKRTKSSAVLL